jgi:hypothetical protein
VALEGGFVVDGGRDRRLEERARVLGFGDLRGYLQARCDTGDSVPRIAIELGVGGWQVQAALARSGVRLAPRRERLAQQRRRYTQARIAARASELGFADLQAYLADRVVERGWLLAEVASELAAHRLTVRRLLDRHGIRRLRRTPAERAASESGRRVQSMGWQARRAAQLAVLGFEDLASYLRARHLKQGWSVTRMRAKLRVGRSWLVTEMARLGAATLTVSPTARLLGRASASQRCWGKVLLSTFLLRFTGSHSWRGIQLMERSATGDLDPRADRRWPCRDAVGAHVRVRFLSAGC